MLTARIDKKDQTRIEIRCDICGNPIRSTKEGGIWWKDDRESGDPQTIQFIHKGPCFHKVVAQEAGTHFCDWELSWFIDALGKFKRD